MSNRLGGDTCSLQLGSVAAQDDGQINWPEHSEALVIVLAMDASGNHGLTYQGVATYRVAVIIAYIFVPSDGASIAPFHC